MIYKPDKVSKMKGADIIAEYMMKEKIPYMIGYAGHGAIGMLDSFFNKQDDILSLIHIYRRGKRGITHSVHSSEKQVPFFRSRRRLHPPWLDQAFW